MKQININDSLYNVIKNNPEVKGIMSQLGFEQVNNDTILNSVGKMVSIKKGLAMHHKDLNEVKEAFKKHGILLVEEVTDDNTAKIKSYLERLNNGEDLESVRADFVREFKNVSSKEILNAEQELLNDGMPKEEVQKLCDVHSALFHENNNDLIKNNNGTLSFNAFDPNLNQDVALENIPNHPLNIFTRENMAIEKLVSEIQNHLHDDELRNKLLQDLLDIKIHYTKKGDLLYPLLKVKYGIDGPSEVMWQVDIDIRNELNTLCKLSNYNETYFKRLDDLLNRIKEMVYKENNILFPICAENFSTSEWDSIYFDSLDYDPCFGIETGKYEAAINRKQENNLEIKDKIIKLPGGSFSIEQLRAILNTMPYEITYVDENDTNRFFNEGEKLFKRPSLAIGRDVYSCHPPKVQEIVRNMLSDFKANKKDDVAIWMEKGNQLFYVHYLAVRDENGKYLGVLELCQNMEFAKTYFKRLFDKKA